MNRPFLTRPILGVCIAVMALAAQAQSPGAQPGSTPSQSGKSAAMNAGSPSSDAQTAPPAHMQRATPHRGSTGHKAMPEASNETSGDTAYRSALRSCVEGPAAQRDTCLDSAIARYGRS